MEAWQFCFSFLWKKRVVSFPFLFPFHVTFMTVCFKARKNICFVALRQSPTLQPEWGCNPKVVLFSLLCESGNWRGEKLTLWQSDFMNPSVHVNMQLAHAYLHSLISSFLYYLFEPQCALWAAGKQMSRSVKMGAFLSQIDVHIGCFLTCTF